MDREQGHERGQEHGQEQNRAMSQAWLRRLVGAWTYEFSTAADAGEPVATATGTERVRAMGDAWVVAETEGRSADGDASHSVTTIGFDRAKGRFTGAVAGTMAPFLFVYDGALSEDGRSLILETEGPALAEGRATDRYRDVLTFEGDDARVSRALVLEADGAWREFMSTRYRRAA